jgi:L-iditol 2-dehydrogenase
MRALRLDAPYTLNPVEVPLPEPGPGEVRVRVAYCGICGSDLHSYRGRHPNVHPPIILGHECSGRIDRVGEGVDARRVGSAVAVEPSLTCGRCWACTSGRYNICEHLRVVGNVGADGAFADALVVPEAKAIPLGGLHLQDGALVEPAAVASRALEQAGSLLGGALVLGAGPVGLMVAQMALVLGAPKVWVVEPNPARRAQAEALGAQVLPGGSAEEVARAVRQAFDGVGAPVVLDCVAIPATLDAAVASVRKGGRVVLVGVPEERALVDVARVQDAEIELVGTLMYQRRHFEQAIALMQRGLLRTEGLISQVVSLDETPATFRSLSADPGSSVKVLVRLAGDEA